MKVENITSIKSGDRTRIKIAAHKRLGEINEDLIGVTISTTSAASLSGTAVAGTGTVSAGTALQSGGTSLMSCGPESSSASSILNCMNFLGSGGAAQWSIAQPTLGSSAQTIVGSIIQPSGFIVGYVSGDKLISPS